MSGRPVHFLAAAAIAAAASFVSISAASAGCYSCGGSYTYAAPVAYYTAPVVYSYSYAAPAAYAAPSCNCGSYAAPAPMYVVNQGPSYTAPVTINAEPTPAYPAYEGYGYRRSAPYEADGPRWHRRHWNRGYGARHYGGRYGYHGYRHRRFGIHRYRYGAVVPGMRHLGIHRGMRHPMVGPGGIHRGPRHAGGMHPGFVHPPRHPAGVVAPRGPMKKMP
jgi:hypothetical protein